MPFLIFALVIFLIIRVKIIKSCIIDCAIRFDIQSVQWKHCCVCVTEIQSVNRILGQILWTRLVRITATNVVVQSLNEGDNCLTFYKLSTETIPCPKSNLPSSLIVMRVYDMIGNVWERIYIWFYCDNGEGYHLSPDSVCIIWIQSFAMHKKMLVKAQTSSQ